MLQPFLSFLHATWLFSDPESSLHHVTWSARVHHDYQGHQPVEPIYVSDSDEAMKADLQLYDGDKYFLSVHACNGAGICLLQDQVHLACFFFISLFESILFQVITFYVHVFDSQLESDLIMNRSTM